MRFLAFFLGSLLTAQTLPVSGQKYPRIAIRNAMVADGNGTPASGPKDILIEGNRIVAVGGRGIRADVEIDAKGKYVLPGAGCVPTRRSMRKASMYCRV